MVEVLPPLEKQRVANELEPRSEFQRAIAKHGLKLRGGNVSCVLDLIQIWLEVDIRLYEENVVNCMGHDTSVNLFCRTVLRHTLMFTPFAIARSLVVYPRQELEVLNGDLRRFDAKLMVQLALSSPLHALDRLC